MSQSGELKGSLAPELVFLGTSGAIQVPSFHCSCEVCEAARGNPQTSPYMNIDCPNRSRGFSWNARLLGRSTEFSLRIGTLIISGVLPLLGRLRLLRNGHASRPTYEAINLGL